MNNKNILIDNEPNSLSTYLREVERIPLLNREQEYDLAIKAKNGDREARAKLVESNSRFVISIAKQFQGRGLPLSDLISEGNVGLLVAIDKFEPETGNHFISYAIWWIRQSILKALNEKSRMVRLPANKIKDADIYGINVTSLDTPINDEEDSSLGDVIQSSEDSPEDTVVEQSLTEAIDKALSSFDEKERDIIIRRFGLHNTEPMSLQEIGTLYGVTKERIRQIEKKVLTSMREIDEVKDLRAYIAC
ncbi:MAG: RNA polymerase sigma factor RpoD/SigA [Sphaerochaetaceae bacterium]|nr:RNA polymerase sigma factor RpoD/SigA [Sphaerochaetaceae bacterium]